jgi:hypothetical protein
VGQALREARRLISEGRQQEAADLLSAAVKKHPVLPELRTNLGYVYELLGRTDDAVEQYAAIVAVAPSNAYAADRLERIFYGERFPTRLLSEQLSLLPVQFVRFSVRRPDEEEIQAASTVSVLFPGEMRVSGRPISKIIPPGVLTGEKCELNRVIYGFAAMPKSAHLWQCVRVYYPSNLLSREGRDYGPLAASLARMAVRFEAYLGVLVSYSEPPFPLSVWLCEGGPAGGETVEGNVYLYQVETLRPGEEWQRELAHEMAHVRLPSLGGYRDPEPSIEGLFGQAWLLAGLAREAEQATGQSWRTQTAKQWIDGLWPVGAVELTHFVDREIRGAVSVWQAEGPYISDTASAQAARMACGLLLWIQAAHGAEALRSVLGGEGGTLSALAGRYANWTQQSGEKLVFSARAGWPGEEPPEEWLPFGPAIAQADRDRPWRTKCFLPAGAWEAVADGKTTLLARWKRVLADEDPSKPWGTQIVSQGEWGTLELAGPTDQPVRFGYVVLRPRPQA